MTNIRLPATATNKTTPQTEHKQDDKSIELTADGTLIAKSKLREKFTILKSIDTHLGDEKEIKRLTQDIKKETEGYFTGWTGSGQKIYLKELVTKLITDNKIKNKKIIEAFKDESKAQNLLELLYNAKYIFLTSDLAERDTYIKAFMQALSALENQMGANELAAYMQACQIEDNVFRLLPLVISIIKIHHTHLDEFHFSEIIGHRIAYAIAKNPGKLKKVIIYGEKNEILHSYSVEEIIVLKNDGERDRGLAGAMLIPDALSENNKLTIVWAGTYNTETIKIDSEITPGEESFRRSEDQILKQILKKIDTFQHAYHQPIHIEIIGHSLGGALSQLTFHSLQRIIALGLEEKTMHDKVKEIDATFQKQLTQETANINHQRPLTDLRLTTAKVKKITLSTWNSPGVLNAVANSSNQLSLLLADHICQQANYGMVHGDIVQTSGRGMVLNEAGKNKAFVKILKVVPNGVDFTTKSLASVGSLSAGKVIGAAAFGGPIGATAAAVTLGGATYISLSKLTSDAHKMHHFKESNNPSLPYVLLTSHTSDGSLNPSETGIAAICKELNCKSVVLDAGARALSLFNITEARTKTTQEQEEAMFITNLKLAESENKVIEFFISEMKLKKPNTCTRILKAIEDKKITINSVDHSGKSLLHSAIELNDAETALKLLEVKDININLQDNFGNTPLLTLMLGNSINYDIGMKLLSSEALDINQKNKNGISPRTLHDGWRSYGTPGTKAREFCLKLHEILIGSSNKIPSGLSLKK